MRRVAMHACVVACLLLSCLPLGTAVAGGSAPCAQSGAASVGLQAPAQAQTLLDEEARLVHPVDAALVGRWRADISQSSTPPRQAALDAIHLGEYLLAHDDEPLVALDQFRAAQNRDASDPSVVGLARYDTALAEYKHGAFEDARDDARALLSTRLIGFNRDRCALFMRHAGACWGYHAGNAAAGIPEPPFLDPLCGPAALASSLKTLGLPYGRSQVLHRCRVTGEGASLADLVAAGPKLGASVYIAQADEAGLKALPKPVIAFVEHDHFVSIVRADAHGVSYLCSDCGAWPGGRVDLTWPQFRRMGPGIYGVVAKPGSAVDAYFKSCKPGQSEPDSLAMVSGVNKVATIGALTLQASPMLRQLMLIGTLLKGHVIANPLQGSTIICTGYADIGHCDNCVTCCLLDSLTSGLPFGPSFMDPVNLATGEEEYGPITDMTVYNPIGPNVVWSRIYNSIRNNTSNEDLYESQDYGPNAGWSPSYNATVQDPNVFLTQIAGPVIAAGASGTLTGGPSGALTYWYVWENYIPMGSSFNPNGWSVSASPGGNLIVTVPASANVPAN